jgi:hypothetical protein
MTWFVARLHSSDKVIVVVGFDDSGNIGNRVICRHSSNILEEHLVREESRQSVSVLLSVNA